MTMSLTFSTEIERQLLFKMFRMPSCLSRVDNFVSTFSIKRSVYLRFAVALNMTLLSCIVCPSCGVHFTHRITLRIIPMTSDTMHPCVTSSINNGLKVHDVASVICE